MTCPLVPGLAAGSIPVAVTCRVPGFSRQAFYAWKHNPVSRRDRDDAHLINAAIDIHAGDPAFEYRFITGELAAAGISAGENRVARQQIWPVLARRRGLTRKAGPPVHDDLAGRQFTAARPDELWLTDITGHPAAEGKLCLCAIKDVYSNRIAGYSMNARMTAALAVSALNNAVALRSPAGTIVLHSDRGSQFRSAAFVTALHRNGLTGSMGRVGACGDNAAMESFFACCRRMSWTGTAGPPARNSGWRSSPGSKAPATADAGNEASVASRPSSTRQSTRPQPLPEPPSPRVN
jgi:putative transposase